MMVVTAAIITSARHAFKLSATFNYEVFLMETRTDRDVVTNDKRTYMENERGDSSMLLKYRLYSIALT